MEENNVFQEPTEVVEKTPVEGGKKPLDVAALVLGIVAIAAAAFIPLVSYICGIIGLVFAIRHRKEKRTTVALILCIVGLAGGVASNIYTAQKVMEVMNTASQSAS